MPTKPSDKEAFEVTILSATSQKGALEFSKNKQSIQRGKIYNAWLLKILSESGIVCVITDNQGPKTEKSTANYGVKFEKLEEVSKHELRLLTRYTDMVLSETTSEAIRVILGNSITRTLELNDDFEEHKRLRSTWADANLKHIEEHHISSIH